MMTDTGLSVHLRWSKIHLNLILIIYLTLVLCTWYYFYNIALSTIISIGLSIWLYHYLSQVLLINANAVCHINLSGKDIFIKKNNQSNAQYNEFYLSYQSRFLVIITTKNESIVIFKDGISTPSFSALNRFLNVNI